MICPVPPEEDCPAGWLAVALVLLIAVSAAARFIVGSPPDRKPVLERLGGER